jgi:hypothetical protein
MLNNNTFKQPNKIKEFKIEENKQDGAEMFIHDAESGCYFMRVTFDHDYEDDEFYPDENRLYSFNNKNTYTFPLTQE